MKLLKVSIILLMVMFPAVTFGAEYDKNLIEREVMKVLDDFIESFSAKDPVAHAATYHFPHFRLARGVMTTGESAEDIIQAHIELFKILPNSGWHKSIWVKREIINISEVKIHVNTRFRRLRKDGSEIGTYDSLYILSNYLLHDLRIFPLEKHYKRIARDRSLLWALGPQL